MELVEVAIALACAVLLVGVVVAIVNEIRHPCLRYGAQQMCSGFHEINKVLVPYTYDCTPCIERKP
jgi:hypothetical protein